MKKIVIMPGGFHPFHAGHMALYNAARETFPSADVFVAATDDTSSRPFPFELKQKLARIAGIDGHRFIQVKSPFQAREITQHYDPKDTVLIFARSEKDRDSQPMPGGTKKDGTASYLQPYKRNGLQPMSEHGYMVYLPTVQFGPGMTSATEIRAKWPGLEPEQKVRLVQQLYPDTVQKTKLADVIVKMFDEVMGSTVEEGLGKTLGTAALAGAMALSPMASKAQSTDVSSALQSMRRDDSRIQQNQSTQQLAQMIYNQMVQQRGQPMDSQQKQKWMIIAQEKAQAQMQRQGYRESEMDEATLVNDPDAGPQIRPEGGMGTWNEQTLVSDLGRKFADVLGKLKGRDYRAVHTMLYRDRWIQSLVKALAELEAFQAKQGRRPMAPGREVDTTDYIDEKRIDSSAP